ncbi:MAG: cytochrome P460 family protein [Gammaproteobacteria bacterium]
MKHWQSWAIALAVGCSMTACVQQAVTPPSDDTAYAALLWKTLAEAHLIGPGAIHSKPFIDFRPHGVIAENVESALTVAGQTGPVIVKRNYGGADARLDKVATDPDHYLTSVSVMFRRPGYDSANRDWFWAEYKPDGALAHNAQGAPLAGRAVQGAGGCVACHALAPGNDRVFSHDRYAK